MSAKTKHVEVLCDKHTHAGRDYQKGDIIIDMPADSADWLIGTKRAREADAAAVKQLKQEN